MHLPQLLQVLVVVVWDLVVVVVVVVVSKNVFLLFIIIAYTGKLVMNLSYQMALSVILNPKIQPFKNGGILF